MFWGQSLFGICYFYCFSMNSLKTLFTYHPTHELIWSSHNGQSGPIATMVPQIFYSRPDYLQTKVTWKTAELPMYSDWADTVLPSNRIAGNVAGIVWQSHSGGNCLNCLVGRKMRSTVVIKISEEAGKKLTGKLSSCLTGQIYFAVAVMALMHTVKPYLPYLSWPYLP